MQQQEPTYTLKVKHSTAMKILAAMEDVPAKHVRADLNDIENQLAEQSVQMQREAAAALIRDQEGPKA